MVNTLFIGKVMFVNQPIIMLELGCRRLAGGGVEWLKNDTVLICQYSTWTL